MQSVIIHLTPRFRVTSHGRGLSYTFDNLENGRSLFFQDDDARAFERCLDAMSNAQPERLFDDILAELWSQYV